MRVQEIGRWCTFKCTLIYILRHAIQQNLIEQGILFALQDKRLNTALIAILQQPQNDWHIEQLAELATMSRANFIRVFQQQLGMSPGRFLTKVRLQSAAFLLKQSQQSVACHCFRSGGINQKRIFVKF